MSEGVWSPSLSLSFRTPARARPGRPGAAHRRALWIPCLCFSATGGGGGGGGGERRWAGRDAHAHAHMHTRTHAHTEMKDTGNVSSCHHLLLKITVLFLSSFNFHSLTSIA